MLQAFITSCYVAGASYATGTLKKSIAIPKYYTEMLIRSSFSVNPVQTATVITQTLSTMTIGQIFSSELTFVYEGSDSDFYYFHSEKVTSFEDNSLHIYAR